MDYPLDQSVWRRGWNDTKKAWTSWIFVIFNAIVAAAIGGIFGWHWGLSVVVFGMFCAWLSKTALAPIKQRNEARNKVRRLLINNTPSIVVKPATGKRESGWERAEHLMWAELQIKNTNTKEMKDVQVNIVECLTLQEKQDSTNPKDFIMWDFLKLAPFCVYWPERQAQPKQISLDIPKGATRSALIAYQDNSNGLNFIFNTFNHNWVTGDAKIGVEISSCETLLWRGNFYLQCHPNYTDGTRARFEFIEWDLWVKDKNVTLLKSDKEISQN